MDRFAELLGDLAELLRNVAELPGALTELLRGLTEPLGDVPELLARPRSASGKAGWRSSTQRERSAPGCARKSELS